MSDVLIRLARPDELAIVRSRYAEWGYGGGVGADDSVLIAERDGELIASRPADQGRQPSVWLAPTPCPVRAPVRGTPPPARPDFRWSGRPCAGARRRHDDGHV